MDKPESYPARLPVPAQYRDPSIQWDEYSTAISSPRYNYTADEVKACPVWADDVTKVNDAEIWDRKSYFNADHGSMRTLREALLGNVGDYTLPNQLPQNPWRRTGLVGRGLLGKFGPNHAADPIVVRFNPTIMQLEFVAVKRCDTGQWAIPGGMVDAGESVTHTLRREFHEEAGSSNTEELLTKVFAKSYLVYAGYANDFRDTDNAWIETSCHIFFPQDNCTKQLTLKPQQGENTAASWISLSDIDTIDFFAGHKRYLAKAKDIAQHIMTAALSRKFIETMAVSTALMNGGTPPQSDDKKRKREDERGESEVSYIG